MAKLKIDLFLNSLNRQGSFEMILPNDLPEESGRPIKTVFHLHGYTGKAESWVPEELVQKYNIAVVSPNGENGFYLIGLSTGHN